MVTGSCLNSLMEGLKESVTAPSSWLSEASLSLDRSLDSEACLGSEVASFIMKQTVSCNQVVNTTSLFLPLLNSSSGVSYPSLPLDNLSSSSLLSEKSVALNSGAEKSAISS